MEAGHVELIPFKVPEDEGRSLYVSALPTNLNHGELAVSSCDHVCLLASSQPLTAGADEHALLTVWVGL